MNKPNSYPVLFYKKFSLRSLKYEWRWRITASNGRIIGASTEGYINKGDCIYNAQSVGISLIEVI